MDFVAKPQASIFSVIICFILSLIPSFGFANTAIMGAVDHAVLKQIENLLETSKQDVDYAHVKLTIDKLIDPSVDIEAEKQRLDVMVADIQAMGDFTTSLQKKDALRRYIY